jgi:acyl carrier protein
MSLPRAALEFVIENAESNGAREPGRADDLFKMGALDSFALVDFVTVLEEHCGISVPDADVNPANFRTIESIERYVESRRAEH